MSQFAAGHFASRQFAAGHFGSVAEQQPQSQLGGAGRRVRFSASHASTHKPKLVEHDSPVNQLEGLREYPTLLSFKELVVDRYERDKPPADMTSMLHWALSLLGELKPIKHTQETEIISLLMLSENEDELCFMTLK